MYILSFFLLFFFCVFLGRYLGHMCSSGQCVCVCVCVGMSLSEDIKMAEVPVPGFRKYRTEKIATLELECNTTRNIKNHRHRRHMGKDFGPRAAAPATTGYQETRSASTGSLFA
jgi:hypothetical protein